MGRLQDKICVVTGAASGIGAKTAELWSAEGAKVVMLDIRLEPLEKEAEKIRKAGGEVSVFEADISSAESCNLVVEKILSVYGRIDVLANIAGILDMGMRPIDALLDSDLEKVINVNLKGTMYLTRAVTKVFEKQGTGNVIMLASVAGITGNGSAAYAASKGAIIALTKNIALRFANRKPLIRANCLCPGTVWTPMTKKASGAKSEYCPEAKELMDSIQAHTSLKSGICMPEDVANTLLFLASEESRCMTGQIITLDCGANL